MLSSGKDNEKAFDSIIQAPKKTQRAIELAFYYIGKDHISELSRQMLAKDKTGRVYIIRSKAGRRRRHVASAPGQTAANLSGNMRKSRSFKLRGSDQLEFGIEGAIYARYLELGTKNIAPRPTLRNTVKALQKNTNNEFMQSLEKKLK